MKTLDVFIAKLTSEKNYKSSKTENLIRFQKLF
jgi:hypothetical protein